MVNVTFDWTQDVLRRTILSGNAHGNHGDGLPVVEAEQSRFFLHQLPRGSTGTPEISPPHWRLYPECISV